MGNELVVKEKKPHKIFYLTHCQLYDQALIINFSDHIGFLVIFKVGVEILQRMDWIYRQCSFHEWNWISKIVQDYGLEQIFPQKQCYVDEFPRPAIKAYLIRNVAKLLY